MLNGQKLTHSERRFGPGERVFGAGISVHVDEDCLIVAAERELVVLESADQRLRVTPCREQVLLFAVQLQQAVLSLLKEEITWPSPQYQRIIIHSFLNTHICKEEG